MERFWDGSGWTENLRPGENGTQLWEPEQPGYAAKPLVATASRAWRRDPEYANPGLRIVARLIDFSLTTPIGYGLAVLLFLPTDLDLLGLIGQWWKGFLHSIDAGNKVLMPWDVPPLWKAVVTILLVDSAVKLIYNVMMLSAIGASVGRMIVKIKVVSASDVYETRLDPGSALVRQILGRIIDLIPVLNLVNWLSPSWTQRRRAVHDSLSNTVVIRVR